MSLLDYLARPPEEALARQRAGLPIAGSGPLAPLTPGPRQPAMPPRRQLGFMEGTGLESALAGIGSLLSPDGRRPAGTAGGPWAGAWDWGRNALDAPPPSEEMDTSGFDMISAGANAGSSLAGLLSGAMKPPAAAPSSKLTTAKPSRAPAELAAPDTTAAGTSYTAGVGSSFERPEQLTKNLERTPEEDDVGGSEAMKWIGRLSVLPFTIVQGLLTGNGALPGILGSLGIGPEAAMERVRAKQAAMNAGAKRAALEQARALGSQVPQNEEQKQHQLKIAELISTLENGPAYGTGGKTQGGGGERRQMGIGEWFEAFVTPRSERQEQFAEDMRPMQEEATYLQQVPNILGALRTATGDATTARRQNFADELSLRDDSRADARLGLAYAAEGRAQRGEGRAIASAEAAAARQEAEDQRKQLTGLHSMLSARLRRTGGGSADSLRLALESKQPAAIKAAMAASGIPAEAYQESTWDWNPFTATPGIDSSKIPDSSEENAGIEKQLRTIEDLLAGGPSFASGGDDAGTSGTAPQPKSTITITQEVIDAHPDWSDAQVDAEVRRLLGK